MTCEIIAQDVWLVNGSSSNYLLSGTNSRASRRLHSTPTAYRPSERFSFRDRFNRAAVAANPIAVRDLAPTPTFGTIRASREATVVAADS